MLRKTARIAVVQTVSEPPMPLVTVTNAHLGFGHVALLDGAELAIDPGERIALVGRNGAGKSSLLKAIAGELALDDGTIVRAAGTTIAYVAQEPRFAGGTTVFEAVAAGLAGESAQLVEYDRLTEALASAADPAPLFARLQTLQTALEASGAWLMRTRIERTLSRLLAPRRLDVVDRLFADVLRLPAVGELLRGEVFSQQKEEEEKENRAHRRWFLILEKTRSKNSRARLCVQNPSVLTSEGERRGKTNVGEVSNLSDVKTAAKPLRRRYIGRVSALF